MLKPHSRPQAHLPPQGPHADRRQGDIPSHPSGHHGQAQAGLHALHADTPKPWAAAAQPCSESTSLLRMLALPTAVPVQYWTMRGMVYSPNLG